MNFYKVSDRDLKDWISMGISLWPDYPEKEIAETFHKILNSGKETAFIVRDENNDPVAFVNLSLRYDYVEGSMTSPVAYIEGIYVEQAHRNKGIAKKLVKLSEEWGRSHGCTELGSDTELSNVNSQAFHQRIGFTKSETIVHFIKALQ